MLKRKVPNIADVLKMGKDLELIMAVSVYKKINTHLKRPQAIIVSIN